MKNFKLGGELGRCGEPTTYAEFRWVRGKNTAVKVVNFYRGGEHAGGVFLRGEGICGESPPHQGDFDILPIFSLKT